MQLYHSYHTSSLIFFLVLTVIRTGGNRYNLLVISDEIAQRIDDVIYIQKMHALFPSRCIDLV